MSALELFLNNTDALIQQLQPAQVKKLTREIAREMRPRIAKRIKENRTADNIAYAPRKGSQWKLRKLREGEKIRPGQKFNFMIKDRPRSRGQFDLVLKNVIDKGNRFVGVEENDGNRPFAASGFLKKHIYLKGKVKRQLMFQRLPSNKYLEMSADEHQAAIGFMSRVVARIASEHYEGDAKRGLPARELLGFSQDDLDMIELKIFEHLNH